MHCIIILYIGHSTVLYGMRAMHCTYCTLATVLYGLRAMYSAPPDLNNSEARERLHLLQGCAPQQIKTELFKDSFHEQRQYAQF